MNKTQESSRRDGEFGPGARSKYREISCCVNNSMYSRGLGGEFEVLVPDPVSEYFESILRIELEEIDIADVGINRVGQFQF